jgi:chaperone BCS1
MGARRSLFSIRLGMEAFPFSPRIRLLIFPSVQNENRFFLKEEISISYIGRSLKILMDLFSECRIEYLKLVKNKTSIFKRYNDN